jgi:hypothetical protein
MTSVKFIVSGEPFIITKDILDRFPDTILHNAISFGKSQDIQSNVEDLNHNDAKNVDQIVVEFPNRDIKAFRCIRSYMETGIPILMPDLVEKELMIRELNFYGFSDYEKIIRSVKSMEEISAEVNKIPPASELKDSYLAKYMHMLGDVEIVDAKNSNISFIADLSQMPVFDSSELDKQIKTRELVSRTKFGAKLNASDTVKLISLFDTRPSIASRVGAPPIEQERINCQKYKFLKSYNYNPSATFPKLATSLQEFKWQFNLITMGLLEDIFDLPFIVAGGSVLFSIMKLYKYIVPEHIFENHALVTDPIHEFAKLMKNDNLYGNIRRYRRWEQQNNTDSDAIQAQFYALKKQVGMIQEQKVTEDTRDVIGTLMYLNNVIWNKNTLKKCGTPENYQTAGLERKDDLLQDYKSTDIDLFLITREPEKAFEAIVELHKRIQAKIPEFNIVRTQNSVTFDLPKPYRRIQIILRLYHSIQHVLMGFDVDSCCIGYDGKSIVVTERGHRAIQYGYNLVDVTRLSTTYEDRLIKYVKRGFLIALDRHVELDKLMGIVKEKVNLFKDERQFINLYGIQLLLVKLYAINTDNVNLRKWLRIKANDYAPIVNRSDIRKVVRKKMTDVNFITGTNIYKVLLSSVFTVQLYSQSEKCKSTLPDRVTFQTELPHIQDRVDILYTGSFEPVCLDDWYNPH